jgi:hypothetical protein
MTQQRTRTLTQEHAVGGPGTDPFEENTGDLRQQAAAYANIAREAHDDCQRGADAEQELARRRNRSGQ